ncbi:hemerythrin domain-containing protein [Paractinoplanes lichenicola]|uniref:Hemerythrin domain-containing protein n=1 Tax=Paractinoplanes lichenicola TaxID=2802976 RepID=A0ABS1VG16_9ACTN|nr:hemerythrin domain-containing protein [Actinoplanes lichenicola]MBL7253644.1 hemerythrin domain-containing protein [Actinoplanes lichenicola]
MTSAATIERTDTWDMVVVHRVFRREFRILPALVRAVAPGDTTRAEVLGAHLANLALGLHHHHSAEDDLVWPLLLRRAQLHAALIHRMEAQHHRLHEPLEKITEILPRWRDSALAADRDGLADVIAQAAVALDEHLADEEREILPLIEEHLTPAEWKAVGDRGKEVLPKGKMALVFLGSLLEEASPAERRRFLGELPWPVRLLWRLAGERTYAASRDRIRAY